MGGKADAKGLAKKIKAWAREAEHEKMLAACDRAVKADPGMALAHAGRSRALWAMNRPEEAAEAMREAARLEPSDADSLAACADAYYWGDDCEVSARYGRRALEMDPGNEDARWVLVDALAKSGAADDEVLGYCDGGIENNPTSTRFWGEKAECLMDAERHEEAIACCDEGIKRCGTGLVAESENTLHGIRGLSLLALGRHEEAVEGCRAAARDSPDSAIAHRTLGNMLAGAGRHEEAVKSYRRAARAYRRAAKSDPDIVHAHTGMAGSLLILGRYDGALAEARRALKINPRNAQALIAGGAALDRLGRRQRALVWLGRAIRADPRYWPAYQARAVILLGEGLAKEALACCNGAVKAGASRAQAYKLKAEILNKRDRHKAALKWADKADKIEPGNAGVLTTRADALGGLGRNREALECIDRALGIEPGNAMALAMKAALIGSDRPGEALACCERAVEMDPGNRAAQMARIAAELRAGRMKEALGHWEDAKKSCPGIAGTIDAKTGALLDNAAAALAGRGPGGAGGGGR